MMRRFHSGSGSASGGSRMKGQYKVSLRHAETDKTVEGVTLILKHDGLTADFAGYLDVGNVVEVNLRLQDGNAPVTAVGKITNRRLIPSTHHHAMTVAFEGMEPGHAERVAAAVETAIDDLAKFFKDFPSFGDFTDTDGRLLSSLCHRHFLRRKEVFFRGGARDDELDGLFIVRSGMVQVYKKVTRLREEKIAVASAGEIFGELSLVMPKPHTASIRAVNDSELIEITRETYRHLQANHKGVAVKLMEVMLRVLAKRLGRTTKLLFSPVRIR